MNFEETIAAISTPPGRGGMGVVRLSGAESRRIAEALLRLRRPLDSHRATFAVLLDPGSGARLDEVVVTLFAAPHSYTAEDVVEISCHGSPVILGRLLELCLEGGARLAEPGEFTHRAFRNGRLDLTQAEAVRSLIDAKTLYQARVAAGQLHGSTAHSLRPAKDELLHLIAGMEAGIDFADDDVPVMEAPPIQQAIASAAAKLEAMDASFALGRVLAEGLTLAIIGRPNVGKSSLFNRLAERERAIVTAQPGTTRDLVTEDVSIGGIPVRLVDTAGIREAVDEAESIGIRKSMEALADAELVLLLLDASQPFDATERELLEDVAGRRAILAVNKSDLAGEAAVADKLSAIKALPLLSPLPAVATSCRNGAGIEELRQEILHQLGGATGEVETPLTSLRQHECLRRSLESLRKAAASSAAGVPHEMILLDLYEALHALDELTGATASEAILGLIFSTFCIGK